MRKLIPLLTVVLLLTAAACKRSTCEGVVCKNGGSCVDGVCDCLPAFTGATCELHTNPCDTTPCYNGGTCINGVCSCPGHTSGPNCAQQDVPTRMLIYRLAIGQFCPASSTGVLWDSDGSPADIYPVIKKGNTVLFDGSGFGGIYMRTNANYTTWYPMELGGDSITIDEPTNSTYRMELWDYDGGGGADQFMDGFNFTPFTPGNGFPGSVTMNDTAFYHNKFELHVYWNHRW